MANSRIDKGFWDNSWSHLSFEKYTGIEKYIANSRKLNGLFKKLLPKEGSILEIGCARAKQLIYFAKTFGYEVSGIDLSEKGVEVAKTNLRIAGVKGDIRCEDVFATTLPKASFDIVYSAGLVEHFDDLGMILDGHTRLLKRGGTLVITVPNFRNSLYLSMSKIFGTKEWILKMHNLNAMNIETWRRLLKYKGLTVTHLNYFGVIDMTLSFGMIKSRAVLYPMLALNQAVGYASYFMGSSQYLSPYLVIIARK